MESTSIHEGVSHEEALLKRGADIALVKRQVFDGKSSALGVGTSLSGVLNGDIGIGRSVELGNSNTSEVRKILIDESDGRITLDTQTSKYELLDKKLKGLDLDTDLGSVHLPTDSQPARLDNNVVDIPGGNTGDRVYINKPALKDVLLETHGAHVFRVVDWRFMVLAKVGNIHLPYYISSEGTHGKNAGEWYPFFGYTQGWVIKGSNITADGKMDYHPKIDDVRETLNRNLVLPNFMSPEGKLGQGPLVRQEPSIVRFDLKNHLNYKPVRYGSSPQEEIQFVREMTGYAPDGVKRLSAEAIPWIKSVVSVVN